MITDSDFYIVMKLCSGEQVMAILRQEDEEHILVEHPIVMRPIVDFEAGKEKVTAAPLCPFTSDDEFVLDKKNVLYIKKLHHIFIDHYRSIVKEYETSANFVPRGSAESLDWGDEPPTPEEARSAIRQLKNIFEEEEEINWEEKMKFLVDGNDTIN